ncbi:DUF1932 domain-containing protein (plasmid) [Streptosporangium sp. NBC_01495]|uniref:DUF1932 domain-containing protein n=1 Tax=Streptosporangium sp. NBC_01495 TaxID=2903899 RepID=UPI002E35E15C|nr:DUF1932 domain-containing protein [Streptosporangium sp. NBC_01495]
MTPPARAQTIAVLHPGAMGSALARALAAPGRRLVCCLQGRSAPSRRRARDAGLIDLSWGELAGHADVAISVVAPYAAARVADDLLAAGFTGVLIEANAVRPGQVRALAERVRAAGGQLVDACIMGPPPAPAPAEPTRVYLSGPQPALAVATTLLEQTTWLRVAVLGDDLGHASALKLAQSTVQKAGRALALLGHALADQYGVSDQLAREVSRWPNPAANPADFPSVAGRAWRWGDELRDAAAELTEAGLPSDIVADAAALFDMLASFKDTPPDQKAIYRILKDIPGDR